MNLSFTCHHVVQAHCDFEAAVDPLLGVVGALSAVLALCGVLAFLYAVSRS